jgi:hypothetical protein
MQDGTWFLSVAGPRGGRQSIRVLGGPAHWPLQAQTLPIDLGSLSRSARARRRIGNPTPFVDGVVYRLLVDWSLNSAMNYLSGLLSYDYNRAGHPFEPGDESCAVGSLSSLR